MNTYPYVIEFREPPLDLTHGWPDRWAVIDCRNGWEICTCRTSKQARRTIRNFIEADKGRERRTF